jgi:DNA-binding LytR/AlgR family response regulator
MIKCIIIDDEPLAIELLQDFIERTPETTLQASFVSATQALAFVEQSDAELVFLDVQMPDLNGMDFLKHLTRKPMVVLTTAYQQFAVQGYQYDVAGFLEKPIAYGQFLTVIQKVRKKLEELPGVDKGAGHNFLFVRTEYKLMKINFEDILFIEGMKDYSKIYIKQKDKPIITLQNLKSFEEKLQAAHFVRVHRSYIISVAHIEMIHKSSVLIAQHELPISDGFREQLNKIIQLHS